MIKVYYDKPTQVKFYDYEEEKYHYGIAYHDEITCACCGGMFEIEELLLNSPFSYKETIKDLPWVSFEGIIGE